MTPIFKTIDIGSSTYELGRFGDKTFLPEYENDLDYPLYQVEIKKYFPYEKSFIPCPFCNNKNTLLTFSTSAFCGTNTSGGTTTCRYEVYCRICRIFSIFTSEDVSYPYD